MGGGVLSDSMYRYTIGKPGPGRGLEKKRNVTQDTAPSSATDSWQTVVPSTATRPTARAGHASFVVGDRLFVFGGVRSDGSVANDVWSFTFTTGVWLQITPGAGGNALGPRYLHVAVQGPVASQVCLWGGSIDGANRALAQGSTASNAVYCFDVTTSTWTAARNAPPTIGTRVAPVLLESSVAGFAVMGGVAQDASVGTRLFAYRYATDAWTNTLASPVAYAAHAPATVAGAFAYIAGGIIGASGAWNTRVLAVGPAGVWTEQQLACEKGYAGATCAQPLCAQNCWGVGRCVAPDLCECLEGFTGALCTQQRCSECGINLVDLNQPVLWPRAKARAFQCMDALEALIAGVEASLPGFPAKCGQTYQNNYPLSLKVSSKQAWFFNQDTARPLADIAAATAALVSAVA